MVSLTFLAMPLVVPVFWFAQVPSTTNYQLRDYGIGTGGTGGSDTANYSMEGITGETSGNSSTLNYSSRAGLQEVQQANVPSAPTFTNTANWYNKLHFIIHHGANPTDTKFAIAISSDDFVSTSYIQSDFTVGPALGLEDYQTYAAWGGATGNFVIGLQLNTTYKIKVKANQGEYTESAYGPAATAATVDVNLSFDMDVSAIDTETSPPYAVSFGDLLVNTVTDSPTKVWFDLETNAENGAKIYIVGQNTGLKSDAAGYTIISATGNLAALSEGVGAQSSSATQSSGGPLATLTPYDGVGGNIGIIDGQYRTIYTTSAPLVSGRSSFLLKAKSASLTPAGNDYSEVYTTIAAPSY